MPFNPPNNFLPYSVIIDSTSAEAFLVRQSGDAGDVFKIDTRDPSTAGTTFNAVNITPNGGAYAGAAYQINGLRVFNQINSGTQTDTFRAFFGQATCQDTAVISGVNGNLRGMHMVSIHNSSGANADMAGGVFRASVNTAAAAIAIGTVSIAQGIIAQVRYDSFAGTGTITEANGILIKSPTTDANNTITTNIGLNIQDMTGTGITTAYSLKTGTGIAQIGGRLNTAKGSNVASANDLTLGNGGNFFLITGTTQINTLYATSWTAGSSVILEFDDSVTVKHGGTGAGAQIALSGSVDFSATAGDTLSLVYNGTLWREISRAVI